MAIYEMRIYRCLPGRLPALLQRFEKTTLDLWKRHGVERERKWTAFATDPEWIAKRAESEKDGPILSNIVNSFLKPTAFSRLQ
jgi:hypothetical protein